MNILFINEDFCNFWPTWAIIISQFGSFFVFRSKNQTYKTSGTPESNCVSWVPTQSDHTWSIKCQEWRFCSQILILLILTHVDHNYMTVWIIFHLWIQKSDSWSIWITWNQLCQLGTHPEWPYMKYQMFRVKIVLANADFVISDPHGPYLYDTLANFSSFDPKIWPIKHLDHLKAIVSVGYQPRVAMYEESNVQSEDCVHKCVFY